MGSDVAAQDGPDEHDYGLGPVDSPRNDESDYGKTVGSAAEDGLDRIHGMDIGHAEQGQHCQDYESHAGAEIAAIGSDEEFKKRGRTAVQELTGYEPESVTALEWDGDGVWEVTVDVLELSRIPNTTDVIGEYVVKLDDTGTLRGYRRERRYQRGQGSE